VSGLQEILVIVLVIVFILFLPRLTGRGSQKTPSKALQKLSGKLRLAIVASVIWLLLWATFFKPWTGEILAFTLVGLCPIILGWGGLWVIEGFKKKQDV
jgi:hypothetical protein